MTEPLIYTSHGNMKKDDLIFDCLWENQLTGQIVPSIQENGTLGFNVSLGGYIVCKPTYYLKLEDGSKGEIVSQEVNVYHTGQDMRAESGRVN